MFNKAYAHTQKKNIVDWIRDLYRENDSMFKPIDTTKHLHSHNYLAIFVSTNKNKQKWTKYGKRS